MSSPSTAGINENAVITYVRGNKSHGFTEAGLGFGPGLGHGFTEAGLGFGPGLGCGLGCGLGQLFLCMLVAVCGRFSFRLLPISSFCFVAVCRRFGLTGAGGLAGSGWVWVAVVRWVGGGWLAGWSLRWSPISSSLAPQPGWLFSGARQGHNRFLLFQST